MEGETPREDENLGSEEAKESWEIAKEEAEAPFQKRLEELNKVGQEIDVDLDLRKLPKEKFAELTAALTKKEDKIREEMATAITEADKNSKVSESEKKIGEI